MLFKTRYNHEQQRNTSWSHWGQVLQRKNTLSMLQLPKTQVKSGFSSSLSPTHFSSPLRVLLASPFWFFHFPMYTDSSWRVPCRTSQAIFIFHHLWDGTWPLPIPVIWPCKMWDILGEGKTLAPAAPAREGSTSHRASSSCDRSLQCPDVFLSGNLWKGRKQPAARSQRWDRRKAMGKS